MINTLKIKSLNRFYSTPRLIFIFFVLAIASIQIFAPLVTPVTDDWIFYPWQTRQTVPVNYSDFELFVGQQQILMKYVLFLTSYIPFLSAPFSGLVNLGFGAIGIALIIKSQIMFHGKKTPKLLVPALIVISFSFKPLYMYFMATSLGSMLSLFFMGIYLFIKNTKNKKKWILIPILFLSPFAFGSGLVIVICESIEQIYKYSCRKYTKLDIKNTFAIVFTCFLSVFLSQALPAYMKNYNLFVGGAPKSISVGIIGIFSNPVNAFKFILISIGNIFVPASRFDPIAPLIAGLIFLTYIMFFMHKKVSNKIIISIIENKSCVLSGLVFIIMTLIARGADSNLGYASAIAPRYITGSFVFTLGILVIISKVVNGNLKTIVFSWSLWLVIISVLISGFKTGLEWHSVRRSQTLILHRCVENSTRADIEIGGKCFNLAKNIRNPVSDEVFANELRNFARFGYLGR
jgi:hypothetical protein